METKISRADRQYWQTRWTLEGLLPDPEGSGVDQAITELEAATVTIEKLRPTLSSGMKGEDFAKVLKAVENFTELIERLDSYGQLWFSEDTRNQAALAFIGRIEKLLTESYNRTLFLTLWWKSLKDEVAERLLAYAGDLRYSLEQERLFRDYTLTEAEEKIINLKDINGIDAMVTLYDMTTNKFIFKLEIEGQRKQLTRNELMAYMWDSSPEVREAAYQEQFRVYGQEATMLAQIYIHRVRDWTSENLNLRRFASPIAMRNLANNIPDEIVDTLLDVCTEQATVFHRYFKLKAEWLNLPRGKLRRYDLYAPFSKKANKRIDYGDAVEIVLDSFNKFSPIVADHARRIFKDRHIDAEIRPGKCSSAFCLSVLPGITPWILINYTGEVHQVTTLAHELGHAIHDLLAANHSVLSFRPTLPMAETASVFSEILLTDHLLAEENNPDVRCNLLAQTLDNAYATIIRQAYLVLFECEAHRMVPEGGTMEDLNQHYLANLAQQFGDSVEISEDFQHQWLCIPHIYHIPFYCYAYSFGQLLSLSLYQKYKEEGKSFVPKFLKILAYGGSASPTHILSEIGIDMANPDFWCRGFKIIEGMIDELAWLLTTINPQNHILSNTDM